MAGSPLEEAEWMIFGMAVKDARVLRARGQVRAGYRCLLTGLHRAQEWATGGEDWANQLLDAYREASTDYRRECAEPAAPTPSH